MSYHVVVSIQSDQPVGEWYAGVPSSRGTVNAKYFGEVVNYDDIRDELLHGVTEALSFLDEHEEAARVYGKKKR